MGEAIDAHVDKLTRPLGPGVPLFYGNSEVSKDGDNHGWVEGALELVEENMPELVLKLGLNDYEEYNPRDYKHLHELEPQTWVPVMKIISSSATFGFSSAYWTNAKTLNPTSPVPEEKDAK